MHQGQVRELIVTQWDVNINAFDKLAKESEN